MPRILTLAIPNCRVEKSETDLYLHTDDVRHIKLRLIYCHDLSEFSGVYAVKDDYVYPVDLKRLNKEQLLYERQAIQKYTLADAGKTKLVDFMTHLLLELEDMERRQKTIFDQPCNIL